MRFSNEPAILKFFAVYDETPAKDRSVVPLEAIALAAKVNINELVGAIVFSFRSIQAQKSALLAMAEHPGVVQSTITAAKKPRGDRDRKMLHEAVGFIPTPKGTNINFQFGSSERKEQQDEPDATPPDINELFPMITEKQQGWQENRHRLLQDKN